MTSVAVSSKYRIVIPKAVREALRLKPGQRVDVSLDDVGRVLVVPVLNIRSARGFLVPIAGVDPTDAPAGSETSAGPSGSDQSQQHSG